MAWVVDTCVVIDILDNDPTFGLSSATCLQDRLPEGLVVCPVTIVEIAPTLEGNLEMQRAFFRQCGIDDTQPFLMADTEASHAAWYDYVQKKRKGKTAKRPVADILIGGFATRFQGLITRNPDDFRPWYPKLPLEVPLPESD